MCVAADMDITERDSVGNAALCFFVKPESTELLQVSQCRSSSRFRGCFGCFTDIYTNCWQWRGVNMWVFNLSLFLTTAWQSLSGRRIFPDYSFPYRLSLQTTQGKFFNKPLQPFNFLKIKINKKKLNTCLRFWNDARF